MCDCRSNVLHKQRDRNFPVGETGRPGWQYVNSSVLTYSCQTSRISSTVVMASEQHHPQQGRSSETAWRYCGRQQLKVMLCFLAPAEGDNFWNFFCHSANSHIWESWSARFCGSDLTVTCPSGVFSCLQCCLLLPFVTFYRDTKLTYY